MPWGPDRGITSQGSGVGHVVRRVRASECVASQLLLSWLMNGARLVIRVFLAAFAFVAWQVWSDDGHLGSSSYALEELNTTVSDYPNGLPELRRRDFIVDRYGNRIEEAVGDYRVDPRGDIFERHSPATAVPRLPDPSA